MSCRRRVECWATRCFSFGTAPRRSGHWRDRTLTTSRAWPEGKGAVIVSALVVVALAACALLVAVIAGLIWLLRRER